MVGMFRYPACGCAVVSICCAVCKCFCRERWNSQGGVDVAVWWLSETPRMQVNTAVQPHRCRTHMKKRSTSPLEGTLNI